MTTPITGLDGAAKRIEMSYQTRGPVDKVTQYDAASSGSVTDEAQYAYDDWGNLASFTQDVDSAMGGSGRASFAVSYTYAKATPTNGRVNLRRTDASYPGGSDLSYTYPSASNVLNDAAGWVYELKVGAVAVGQYTYDGSGLAVRVRYPEPPMNWTIGGDLDQFNRVTRCDWSSKSQVFYDVSIAYDRDSNITSVADAVRKNASADPNYDAVYNDGRAEPAHGHRRGQVGHRRHRQHQAHAVRELDAGPGGELGELQAGPDGGEQPELF